MAMEYEGKTYRNLQEQVAYLTRFLSANTLANEMGIKVLGRVDSVDDIPAGDYEYGDAYMIGEEGHTPYRMVIWSRDAGDGNPGWFDIGYFPTAPDEFSIVEVNGEPVHIFDADTKLDIVTKITTFRQLYSKKADGSQEMVDVSTAASPYCIVWRVDQSQINMPNQVTYPPSDDQAISKRYAVINFVEKQTSVTTYAQAYVKTNGGEQRMLDVAATANANAIVLRNNQGQIALPNQITYPPTDDDYAVSKRYVDAVVGQLLYLHDIYIVYTIDANTTLGIRCYLVNGSSTAITALSNNDVLRMVPSYGALNPAADDAIACAITKMPNGFHSYNFNQPNLGFLYQYFSGGSLISGNTFGLSMTFVDVVVSF